jgi:rhodanese-related sulfurtransferase
LPLKRLEANLDKLTPLKTRKILVYCRSGSRSIAASRILEKHGFTPLNIKGGIIGLANAHADIIQ